MLGAAAVSRPLWMIYGEKFAPAVPVFVIMSILSISRVVQGPAWVFLQATDNQGRLLIIGIVSSIINLGLDVLLIPSLGAIGAALGSGSAQWFAAICAWVLVARKFSPDLMPGMFGRVLLSGLVMAAIVVMITLSLPPVPGAILGIAAGVVIYIGMLRLTHALRPEDRGRLESLSGVLPVALRSPVNRLLWHLIPHAPAR
jgi:O-antigen/teichoic acid export membrane protein